MNIRLLDNNDEIRQKYINSFLLTKTDFELTHRDFVSDLKQSGKDYEAWYDNSFMWDRMPSEYHIISISKARESLKDKSVDVLFMSEKKGFGGTCRLVLENEMIEGFVAKTDAAELAKLIEYEWYTGWKAFWEERYFEGSLPEDLYIFDETFRWTIVFTHETDWNAEGATKPETRFCIEHTVI